MSGGITMKKFLSYLIVIVITYAVATYIHNPELRKKINKKINSIFQRTPQEVVIKNMYVKSKLVYVKKEPQDTAEILGTLKRGTEVGLITIQEKWAKVKTPAGVSGWVSVNSLSDQPLQVTKKEVVKKEELRKEEQIYQDLSSAETEKIPSSVVSIFDNQPKVEDDVPDIIRQEIKSKKTIQQKTKTETTKTEQKKISQEISPTVSVSTPQQQETTLIEKPKRTKKETVTTTPNATEEIKNCPRCGAEVIKGERFCIICREPLSR